MATALEQSIHEGVARLNRSWPELLATGTVGGIDLGLGVLALLIVRDVTGSRQLGALAFSVGFIALVLAKSELFTENFLVPIAAVISRNASWWQVLRLWGGTAVMNLVGGWVIMSIVILGVPRLGETATTIELGQHYPDLGIGVTSFMSAVLGGTIITLMTWMERGTRSMLGKLTAAVVAAFLLAGAPALHSIVTSLEMFAALQAGAPFGYLDWLGTFGWAVLGNMVGGIGLVTMLRFVQVGREKIAEERARPTREVAD
ncbi:MAG: formate/nitrite transporter family protein [Actinobacteria bacterium]|nr:formate/nitrite transporter family protein [Actinomycetota bacterium]